MDNSHQLTLNNFKKFTSKALPLSQNLFITGDSGTGKTQLLWAYLLFFRAHNFNFTTENKTISLHKEANFLLDSNLSDVTSWKSFVKQLNADKIHGFAEFNASFYGEDLKFQLHANGVLLFTSESLQNTKKKIAYAHMSSTYNFTVKIEKQFQLSSMTQSLRIKYHLLCQEHKNSISKTMNLFFGITRIEEDKNYQINFYECGDDSDDDVCIEVMFQSSCIQKVFASLILFYTLIQFKFNSEAPAEKYYLIDNPEIHVGPELLGEYMQELLKLSKVNDVKIIVASSAEKIGCLFDLNEKMHLPSRKKVLQHV